MSSQPVLNVDRLKTYFYMGDDRVAKAVDDVSFNILPGETVALVGESGSGKSITALSVMQLISKPGEIVHGEITMNNLELLQLSTKEMGMIRGNEIAMIFQEPMTALNPVHRIGKQIGEVFSLHFPEMDEASIQLSAIELLEKVGIPDPKKRLYEYPHQLSGGMRQRVMIAMALACKPDILIADEPTTALDVTIQAQILELMQSLQKETGMAIIFITHDLGVIAEICDEVVVMYAGKAVEQASVYNIFKFPHHPYTQGLLSSIPRLDNQSKQKLKTIEGSVPDLMNIPSGCRFQNRCLHQIPQCQVDSPPMEAVEEYHLADGHTEGQNVEPPPGIPDHTGPHSNESHFVSCYRWKDIQPNITN